MYGMELRAITTTRELFLARFGSLAMPISEYQGTCRRAIGRRTLAATRQRIGGSVKRSGVPLTRPYSSPAVQEEIARAREVISGVGVATATAVSYS